MFAIHFPDILPNLPGGAALRLSYKVRNLHLRDQGDRVPKGKHIVNAYSNGVCSGAAVLLLDDQPHDVINFASVKLTTG